MEKEIKTLRGAAKKVYQIDNNRYKAVYSANSKHYYDEENGEYHSFDNTIIRDDEGRYYINRAGNFKARFSREDEAEEIFSIEKGMYKVTVSANRNARKRERSFVHRLESRNDRGTVLYSDVYDGADLEYSMDNAGVKENIVINEKQDSYHYSFMLNCENVTCGRDEDGSIRFCSCENGEEVFYIPAPYMYDANGETSYAVVQELREQGGSIILTLSCSSEWINEKARVFPVTVDPQIELSEDEAIQTYSYENGVITNDKQSHSIGQKAYKENRMYISAEFYRGAPYVRIKKAELRITQKSFNITTGSYPRLGLYAVSGSISANSYIPPTGKLIDYIVARAPKEGEEVVRYTFDVTSFAERSYEKSYYENFVLKFIDESDLKAGYIDVYGDADVGGYYNTDPELIITYESGYAVNDSYRCHTHDLGRFGKGIVDLHLGTLAFDSMDFNWSGNRMPVTIKHMYNSMIGNIQYTGDSRTNFLIPDFYRMNIGKGFRLNLMQSLLQRDIYYDGYREYGYVYIDENGNEISLRESDESRYASQGYYKLYKGIDNQNVVYDPELNILTVEENNYEFDMEGRLIRISDKYENKCEITYTDGQITSVTDGAGRTFNFEYTWDWYLSSITAPDETSIHYTYNEYGYLTGITYPNGESTEITYTYFDDVKDVIVKSKEGKQLYRVSYTFYLSKVETVTEYGVQDGEYIKGVSSKYNYNTMARRTEVVTTLRKDECDSETGDTVINTVYTFDDDGNVKGEYAYTKDSGNVMVSTGAGINPHSEENGMKYKKYSENLLLQHDFEGMGSWEIENENCDDMNIELVESNSFYGDKCISIKSDNICACEGGIRQYTYREIDENPYTFSAYVNITKAFQAPSAQGVFLRVTDKNGNILSESEHIYNKTNGYIRLCTTCDKYKGYVIVHILACGKGCAYVDAAQLEKGEYASDYSIISNGGFDKGVDYWRLIGDTAQSTGGFNGRSSLKATGGLELTSYAYQTVYVNSYRNTRETFKLSGWAKAEALPVRNRENTSAPEFRLRAVIQYYDIGLGYDTEEFCAEFSPCTDGWQYAEVEFAKSKCRSVDNIRVYCEYNFNSGTAYFDDISLVRNSIETGVSQSEFVKVDESKEDTTKKDGTGTYDTSYSEDNDTEFEEQYDQYGNPITDTTFKNGLYGTIYRSFGYNDCCCGLPNSGNDRIRETDERGNNTLYKVDPDTSRVTEITDRCGNKTQYTYDKEGNVTKTTMYNKLGTKLSNVSYAYDSFNNITGITRNDGMKYELSYNEFHNLSSIGIRGKAEKLASYEYREGNGRLKKVHYANGDMMKLIYNRIGQVTSEKWFDRNGKLTAHYRYIYNGEGTIVNSVDVLNKKEYNYMYENNRIKRALECNIVLNSDNIVTKKTLVNSILYSYDKEGQLVKKVISSANKAETETVVNYEYDNKSDAVINVVCGNTSFTSHSGTDGFGRKTFDELQTGSGFITRQFTYHSGQATAEHRNNEKLKSGPVTQLVKSIEFSDGRSFSYEYDAEERITRVIETNTAESGQAINDTGYTYDSLGQLLKEVRNGVTINEMTYDNLGNIKSKNGAPYTYGTGPWKDLLIGCCGSNITYDTQGNPIKYLGHTLVWEKGRQLKKYDNNTYTYNASGIRTGKNINGVKHTYRLDGTKILSEKWGNNTLIPLYDNEDGVCGIIYNGTAYYFMKNLQGDVISIKDAHNRSVAEYVYDAWGVCTVVSDSTAEKIADINPFRYRSCYYDAEIKMYYLQSRYYDPEVGRFINADEIKFLNISNSVQNYNLFVVCDNDTINYVDNTGNKKKKVACSGSAVQVDRWLIDLVKKFIPNIYTKGKKLTLFDAKFLGIRLTLQIGIAFNSNPDSIFGILINKNVSEVTISANINQRESFFITGGIDWKRIYMQCGLSVMIKKPYVTYAMTIELSISHLTSAAIIACCVAAPYLSTFVPTVVTAIGSTTSAAATMLVPMIPKFIELVV